MSNESKTPFSDYFFNALLDLAYNGIVLKKGDKIILDREITDKILDTKGVNQWNEDRLILSLLWTKKDPLNLQTIWIKKRLLNYFLHSKDFRSKKETMLTEMQELNRLEADGLKILRNTKRPIIEGGNKELSRLLNAGEEHEFFTFPRGIQIKVRFLIAKAVKRLRKAQCTQTEKEMSLRKTVYSILDKFPKPLEYAYASYKQFNTSMGEEIIGFCTYYKWLTPELIKVINEYGENWLKKLNTNKKTTENPEYKKYKTEFLEIINSNIPRLQKRPKIKRFVQTEYIQRLLRENNITPDNAAEFLCKSFDYDIEKLKLENRGIYFQLGEFCEAEKPETKTLPLTTQTPTGTAATGFNIPETVENASWQPEIDRKKNIENYVKKAAQAKTLETSEQTNLSNGVINYTAAKKPLIDRGMPLPITPLEDSNIFNLVPKETPEQRIIRKQRQEEAETGQLFLPLIDVKDTGKDKDGNRGIIEVRDINGSSNLGIMGKKILEALNAIYYANYQRPFSFEQLLQRLEYNNPKDNVRKEIKECLMKIMSARVYIDTNQADINIYGLGKLTRFSGSLIQIHEFEMGKEVYYSIREMPPLLAFAMERKQIKHYSPEEWEFPNIQKTPITEAMQDYFYSILPKKMYYAKIGKPNNDRITFSELRQEVYHKTAKRLRLYLAKDYSARILDGMKDKGLIKDFKILEDSIHFLYP